MNRADVRRYAIGAVAVAAVFGALLLVVARGRGEAWTAWCGLGWFVMAALGVVGGAWLAAEFGKPGTGFLKALAAGMLARLFAAAGGAGCAVWLGTEEAPWAFLAGAATGFVPLQAFEVVWFYRASRRLLTSGAASGSEPGGRD